MSIAPGLLEDRRRRRRAGPLVVYKRATDKGATIGRPIKFRLPNPMLAHLYCEPKAPDKSRRTLAMGLWHWPRPHADLLYAEVQRRPHAESSLSAWGSDRSIFWSRIPGHSPLNHQLQLTLHCP